MKEKNFNSKCLSWILLGFVFIATILLNYYVQWRCLDSDMASEMVLANLLNQEGSILSKNWFYSTEVRVFCEQIWFQLGLLLSPNNWRIARLIGHSINLAILLGSFIFFLYSTSIKEKGIWIAIVLLLPFDFWYLFYVTFGGFYICHIVTLFLMLGLLLRYINSNERTYLILLFILGILFGLNGVKIIMYFTIPCFITLIVILIYQYISKNAVEKFKLIVIGSIVCFMSTLIGASIYQFIICKEYTCTSPLNRYWGQFSISKMLEIISIYLQSLGYINTDWYSVNVKILSSIGIFGVFGLAIIIAFISSLFLLTRKTIFVACKEKYLVVFIICELFSGICMFSLINETTNGSYWIPCLPFSFIIIELFVETFGSLNRNIDIFKYCILASIIICSFANTKLYLDNHPRTYDDIQEVVDILEKENCKQVIAEFWIGNSITEYTNGQVEAFVVSNYDNNETYNFLQKKDHSNFLETNDMYVIIPKKESYEWAINHYRDNCEILYDNYLVLFRYEKK